MQTFSTVRLKSGAAGQLGPRFLRLLLRIWGEVEALQASERWDLCGVSAAGPPTGRREHLTQEPTAVSFHCGGAADERTARPTTKAEPVHLHRLYLRSVHRNIRRSQQRSATWWQMAAEH